MPTKAVAAWRALDYVSQAKLVELYLQRSGFVDIEIHRLLDGGFSDPMTVVLGRSPHQA